MTHNTNFKFDPADVEQWYAMSEGAKLINRNIGRNNLFDFLREEGFIMHDNEPYQEYIDRGYFKYVVKDIKNPAGTVISIKTVTLISLKGIVHIQKLIDNKNKPSNPI